MTLKNAIYATLTLTLALGLIGCGESQPEDIKNWKEQGNVQKLVGTLTDSRQFMRLEAITALEELQKPEAIAPLAAQLKDPDVVIVHKALEALAAIGGSAIEPYMLDALSYPTVPARLTAATALGACKSTKAVDPLIAALDDEGKEVALAAAVSLGQIGDSKATKPLSEKLTRQTLKMHLACATSLVQIGDPAAAPGLFTALADTSKKVRDIAVQGLIAIGEPSIPLALEGLRSENEYTRISSAEVLKGAGQVPGEGNDLVWYTLASINLNAPVDLAKVTALARIENGIEALIEALVHPEEVLYAYAFRALETMGEPVSAAVTAAAEQQAGKAGRSWYAGRSDWAGAPSWRIDLWGGLTALNPKFKYNPRIVKLLSLHNADARTLMASKSFKPSPEYTPLLLAQTSAPEDTGNVDEKRNLAKNKPLAEKVLLAQGSAIFNPLAAGLLDEDLSVVAGCANVLHKMDGDRARPYLVDAFKAKVDGGIDLASSEFLTLIVQLDDPSTEPYIAKIRPNDARALQMFGRTYPGIRVSILEMPPGDQHPTAEPFRLKYLVDGRAKELKAVFRPNAEGEWVPNPPFPDPLP